MSEETKITQIGVVVRDLDATMKMYHQLLGWGPWNVCEHTAPVLHDTHLHGKPATNSMLCAEVMVGDMCCVLIQPLEGDSIYKEWLEEHGEGLHHVAVMKHGQNAADQFKQDMDTAGAKMLMGGGASVRPSSSITSTASRN